MKSHSIYILLKMARMACKKSCVQQSWRKGNVRHRRFYMAATHVAQSKKETCLIYHFLLTTRSVNACKAAFDSLSGSTSSAFHACSA
jgi:hypothetical protein